MDIFFFSGMECGTLRFLSPPTLTPRLKKKGGRFQVSGSDGVDSDRGDLTWATGAKRLGK